MIAVTVAFAGLVISSSAEAAAIPCVGCETTQEFRERASLRGPGTHYVYNLATNVMQTWRIPTNHRPNSVGGGQVAGVAQSGSGAAVQIENPQAAVQELALAHRVYVIGGRSMRPIWVVPHNELGVSHTSGRTVHDVVYDQNLKAQIESAAASDDLISRITSENFITALIDLKSLATSALGLRDQAGMIIRVEMEDGGYVDVQVDITQSVGTLLTDTARTASGQLVPTHTPIVGTWTYSPVDNLGAMATHMQRLGLPIERRGAARLFGALFALVIFASSNFSKGEFFR